MIQSANISWCVLTFYDFNRVYAMKLAKDWKQLFMSWVGCLYNMAVIIHLRLLLVLPLSLTVHLHVPNTQIAGADNKHE